MQRAVAALFPGLVAAGAQAHPSFVPHGHPHGASALAGLEVSILALIVTACAVLVLRALRRR